jgi:lysozyme
LNRKLARAAAGAAILAALGLAALYLSGRWSFNHPDRRRYPVRGVDVSHHQGAIDWAAVSKDDVAFAYVKASEGGDFRDDRFQEHWRGASGAGVAVGAYHFFTFCRDGATQAANFLGALSRVEGPMLPPAIDLEFRGNCKTRPSEPELKRELGDFAARLQSKLGVAPLYYATPEFLRVYPGAMPEGAALWARSILRPPNRKRSWVFWQYADRERVAGIKSPVDVNVFTGSAEEWRVFLGR